MYRIRLHGRGGQGVKTAGRILGTAFFFEGFEVQDAPRYGAERRGAPVASYVRADRRSVFERGIIARPDLIVVGDETLVPVASAGVLSGMTPQTVLLIQTPEDGETWQERLRFSGRVLTVPLLREEAGERRFVGAACVGAAARLLGVISRECLERAIRQELEGRGAARLEKTLDLALASFDSFESSAGLVVGSSSGGPSDALKPDWIELGVDPAPLAAPLIHGGLTSVEVRTGLWRTVRPVIDLDRCQRCSWVCSTFCPDSVILVGDDRTPSIDYDHCKGCMICAAVCPPHAIAVVPEFEAAAGEAAEAHS